MPGIYRTTHRGYEFCACAAHLNMLVEAIRRSVYVPEEPRIECLDQLRGMQV